MLDGRIGSDVTMSRVGMYMIGVSRGAGCYSVWGMATVGMRVVVVSIVYMVRNTWHACCLSFCLVMAIECALASSLVCDEVNWTGLISCISTV